MKAKGRMDVKRVLFAERWNQIEVPKIEYMAASMIQLVKKGYVLAKTLAMAKK